MRTNGWVDDMPVPEVEVETPKPEKKLGRPSSK